MPKVKLFHCSATVTIPPASDLNIDAVSEFAKLYGFRPVNPQRLIFSADGNDSVALKLLAEALGRVLRKGGAELKFEIDVPQDAGKQEKPKK